MNRYSIHHLSFTDIMLKLLVYLASALTLLVLVFIIAYILIKGVPYLTPSLFSLKYTSENVSMLPAIINTILMCAMSLMVAVPFGVITAVYLVEYAKKGNKLVEVIRTMTETLAGIPSIVYGLFGLLFFVTFLGWGFSMLAGALTLSIMVMPSVMRTTEEALKSVPDAYREGSFGLGAGRLRTIFCIVLPSAVPGILSGIILSVGRIIGETAALIYTAGTVAKIPDNVLSSGRTLAVHMYALSSEGFHTNEAFATAVVMLIVIVGMNAVSSGFARKLSRGQGNV